MKTAFSNPFMAVGHVLSLTRLNCTLKIELIYNCGIFCRFLFLCFMPKMPFPHCLFTCLSGLNCKENVTVKTINDRFCPFVGGKMSAMK